MDGLAHDFDFLVASARRSVAEALAGLGGSSGRRGRGKALGTHVEQTLRAIEARIKDSEVRFAGAGDDVERTAAIETIRLIVGFLSQMQEAGPWVTTAADPPLDIGPLYVVDEAAEAVVGAPNEVVVFGDARYQYATVSWPFESILRQLGRAPTGPRPIVIFYPPQDAGASLLHPLFVHELGHAAVLQHDVTSKVLATRAGDATFRAAYDAAATDLAARATRGDMPAARLMLNQQLQNWITEVVCDDFGAQYAGPAYLFAFAAVVVAISWNEPQTTHPPTTERVAFLLRELDDLGWTPRLEAQTPAILEWLRFVASTSGAPTNSAHEDFLIDSIEAFRPAVHSEVAARLAGNVYAPAAYDADREDIEQLLAHRILPAQLAGARSVDRRTISLAGWLHVFGSPKTPAGAGDHTRSISAAVGSHDFQEFLSKAAEMSKVLDTWQAS